MTAPASKARINSPYRIIHPQPASELGVDPALIFGSVLLLFTSLARLSGPILGLEEWGAEPTIAFLAVLLTSAHLLSTIRAWLARPRAQIAAGNVRVSPPQGERKDRAGPSSTP
jgi:hypothetical protein